MMATGTPISTPNFELWPGPGDGDAELVGSVVVLCVVDISEPATLEEGEDVGG